MERRVAPLFIYLRLFRGLHNAAYDKADDDTIKYPSDMIYDLKAEGRVRGKMILGAVSLYIHPIL